MNNTQNGMTKSQVKPKKSHQPDRYEGGIDPYTKLRNGEGTYRYNNKYFVYQGHYVNNTKEGPGVLKLANGTTIEANFVNGEMQGQAVFKYPDGSMYKGTVNEGERSGYGQYTSPYENYKGNWLNNAKHGNGILELSDGTVVHGVFQHNKIHGMAVVTKWDGEFSGNFQAGKKNGRGKLVDHSMGVIYQGDFKDDIMQGQGKLILTSTKYCYEGEFKADKPVLVANQFDVWVSFNKIEGETKSTTENQLVKSIDYELEGDSFNLEIRSVFQGEPVLDENQPTPEDIDKMIKNWQTENKKIKNPPPMPNFAEPRMKKPEVVLVTNESNRLVSVELQQNVEGAPHKKLQVDFRKDIAVRREEIVNIKKEAAKKLEEEADKKKGAKKEGKGQEPELKVNLYKEEGVPEHLKSIKVLSQRGVCKITDIQFPDDFPPGNYHLEIKNQTLNSHAEFAPCRFDLFINPKGTALAKAGKKK